MRELTFEECHEVTGGMRGNPPLGRQFAFPRDNAPEIASYDANEPVGPSVAQRATCGALTAGAGLMAIPLWLTPPVGPVLAEGAMIATNGLCNAAFASSRR